MKKIWKALIMFVFTFLLLVCAIILFNLIPNYEQGSGQYVMLCVGCVCCAISGGFASIYLAYLICDDD